MSRNQYFQRFHQRFGRLLVSRTSSRRWSSSRLLVHTRSRHKGIPSCTNCRQRLCIRRGSSQNMTNQSSKRQRWVGHRVRKRMPPESLDSHRQRWCSRQQSQWCKIHQRSNKPPCWRAIRALQAYCYEGIRKCVASSLKTDFVLGRWL